MRYTGSLAGVPLYMMVHAPSCNVWTQARGANVKCQQGRGSFWELGDRQTSRLVLLELLSQANILFIQGKGVLPRCTHFRVFFWYPPLAHRPGCTRRFLQRYFFFEAVYFEEVWCLST